METVFVKIADSIWAMSKDKHVQLLDDIGSRKKINYTDYGVLIGTLADDKDHARLDPLGAYDLRRKLYGTPTTD